MFLLRKIQMLLAVGWLLCHLLTENISAQILKIKKETNLRFNHLTIEKGLSNSLVWSILQDSMGFMWFGTQDGLNRFDGHDYMILRSDPRDSTAISDEWIRSIAQDKDGYLWLATETGGINRFDTRTLKSKQYTNKDGLTSNENYVVFIGPTGNIWVGPKTGGVNKYNRIKDAFETIPNDPTAKLQIQSLWEDTKQNLWIGTLGGGLFRYDVQKEALTIESISLPSVLIYSLFEDSDGQLWIGTYGDGLICLDSTQRAGFHRYRYKSTDIHSLSDDRVTSVSEFRKGWLCVTTNGGGVNLFEKKSELFYRYSPNERNPESIQTKNVITSYTDRRGNLWLGTWGAGVEFASLSQTRFKSVTPQNGTFKLESYDAWSFFLNKTNQQLYVGTKDGLEKIDLRTSSSKQFHSSQNSWLGGNLVTSITPVRSDEYLLGIFDVGVVRWDAMKDQFQQFPITPNGSRNIADPQVLQVFKDKSSLFWITTFNDGITLFNEQINSFYHFRNDPNNVSSLSNNRVYRIYQTRDGNIWVGTHGGLDKFTAKDSTFIHYLHDPQDSNSLSHNSISDLFEDNHGFLWVATNGGGLNRLDPHSGLFRRFTVAQGLPNNNVSCMLPDDHGNLWLGTNNGLCKFSMKSGQTRTYGKTDGLPSQEFNGYASFKSDDGELIFGTPSGIAMFHPDSIVDDNGSVPVVITAVKVFNEYLSTGIEPFFLNQLELDYNENFLSFDYAALDYIDPSQNQYAYKLEGLESEWNYVGTRRFANYTDIEPGEYVFCVKATNHDGVWNKENTSLRIFIHPPFWRTTWFGVSAATIALVMLFGGVQWRLKTVKQSNLRLETEVRVRTAELQQAHNTLEQRVEERTTQLRNLTEHMESIREEEKSRIAREVHDELGQYLTVLKMDVANISNVLPREQTSLIEKSNTMMQTIDATIKTVQRIASELRPTILDDLGLVSAIEWQAGEIAKRSGIQCVCRLSSIKLNLPEKLTTSLFRIFQETITNVLRHAHAQSIEINLEIMGSELILEVRDDGVGIESGQVHNTGSLGIVGMHERVRPWNGKINVKGSPGRGTTVQARIPVESIIAGKA